MFNHKCKSFFISIGFFIISFYAHAGYFSQHHFYGGADIGKLSTNFKDGYGANFFDNKILGYNVFFGAQCPSKFGFEAGYSFTPTRKQNVSLNPGDSFPGTSTPVGQSQQYQSSFAITEGYFGLNWTKAIGQKLIFFGLVGAAATQMKISIDFVNGSSNTFNHTQVLPMANVGLQYLFCRTWGLRVYYAWRYFEELNPLVSEANPPRGQLQLSNSNSVYGGLYLQL